MPLAGRATRRPCHAQAVVRVSDPFAFAGLYTRGQNQANGGDGGAYFGNIRGDGLITTGSFTGEQLTLETPLDPVNTDVLKQAVLELRDAGTTVIFSTHDMNTAETMCDFIFMIFRAARCSTAR